MLFILFFLSGAAALVYEVAWTRSLGLVFGASHLAVTTVLAVYMGGQALGSALLGDRADRTDRPLRLYGLLEIGVGLSAVAFLALMKVYPLLYAPLARVAAGDRLALTVLRVAFAVAATIVPTTLMGGTLPTLARFAAGRGAVGVGRQLSFLYAVNTAGAVLGSLLAGFVLLRCIGVTASTLVAAAVSAGVGVASVALQRRIGSSVRAERGRAERVVVEARTHDLVARFTLLAAGVSGFCALGYEVLWTRMLTLVVGTSVYSFTIMLVAFLSGIALGSHAAGVLLRRRASGGGLGAVRLFAGTQVAIGVSALTVTVLMRDLPGAADRLQGALAGIHAGAFGVRLVASFLMAFACMLVPACFMGMAFPLAGAVWSAGRDAVGGVVGRLLTVNTVGAILGTAVSGFFLIYVFGVERSLHLLVVLNVAAGAIVAAGSARRRWLLAAASAAAVALVAARVAFPDWGRAWDPRYFAVYVNSSRSFDTPEHARQELLDTDVLYYHEGVDETVSVVRPRGDVLQSFIVNGRPEASTFVGDVQLQRALGYLPVLLHPAPRRVFVLGTGTGMTHGATSTLTEVEHITLAEIEPAVLGVARTFGEWNHHVLEDPRLTLVFNDGRNHLATTREQYDVITADPIHPWSGGAAYLYTVEYFRSMGARLAPGGIAAQWLPLYELTTRDVRTVVRTFAKGFRHVMVFVTYYDAVLVGSNDPLVVDERELARRLARPAVRADLEPIEMATAGDLLSYFVMGDAGARSFGRGGALNTDDGLTLEFSAPASQGVGFLDGDNVLALAAERESLLPYLVPSAPGRARQEQVEHWTRDLETGRVFDQLHGRFLWGTNKVPGLARSLEALWARVPDYAPLRLLLDEKKFQERAEPALVAAIDVEARAPEGAPVVLRISAVRQFVGRGRALVSFVDEKRREIYGQRYLSGKYEQLEADVSRYVDETLRRFRASAEVAGKGGRGSASEVEAALRREAVQIVGHLPR